MTAATRTLIFAHGESIKMDAMHRNNVGKWKKWALVSRKHCLLPINDPLMECSRNTATVPLACKMPCVSFVVRFNTYVASIEINEIQHK